MYFVLTLHTEIHQKENIRDACRFLRLTLKNLLLLKEKSTQENTNRTRHIIHKEKETRMRYNEELPIREFAFRESQAKSRIDQYSEIFIYIYIRMKYMYVCSSSIG